MTLHHAWRLPNHTGQLNALWWWFAITAPEWNPHNHMLSYWRRPHDECSAIITTQRTISKLSRQINTLWKINHRSLVISGSYHTRWWDLKLKFHPLLIGAISEPPKEKFSTFRTRRNHEAKAATQLSVKLLGGGRCNRPPVDIKIP
jgi:hypothetical protein